MTAASRLNRAASSPPPQKVRVKMTAPKHRETF